MNGMIIILGMYINLVHLAKNHQRPDRHAVIDILTGLYAYAQL